MPYHPVGRPIRREFHRCALILAAAAMLVAPTAVGAADDWTGYAARPAPGDGDRDSGRFELAVTAGSSASDAIEIFNLTDDPAAFDVYAADVVETTGGGRAPASRDIALSGPATWIVVSRAVVELETRSSTLVDFTVEVPADAATGAHTAALLVEPRGTDPLGTITSRTRVGLWVEIQVLDGSDASPVVPSSPAISWDVPWIPLVAVALIVFAAVLLYLSRRRWHSWLEQWREERALIRDFRSRRRHQAATGTHERRG